MEVQLTDEDVWLVNSNSINLQRAAEEYQRLQKAQENLIKMLEVKHGAKFDKDTGKFIKEEDAES